MFSDQRQDLFGEAQVLSNNEQPLRALWLVYLFFRPGSFFKHFVIEESTALTALSAWIYGMAGVIDRLDIRELKEQYIPFQDSWTGYWLLIMIGGVLGGVFYFAVGGWWYRIRLDLSGAVNPDKRLARRVYIFASLIWALPSLLFEAAETYKFDTPMAASHFAGSYWYFILLLFPFWSVFASYIGVRTAFVVRRRLALLWFLILPSLVYSLTILGFMAFVMFAWNPPADVSNPLRYDCNTFAFSYPGNWWIDTENESYDPNADVFIEPIQDAFINIMIYDSDRTVEAELRSSLESIQKHIKLLHEESKFETWGVLRGLGREYLGEVDNQSYVLRMFISNVGENGCLEIHELSQIADEETVRPGFLLIRSTFRLKK